MKKLLSILIFMVFTVNAYADHINIIIPGKPGGSSHARAMLMQTGLELAGYHVDIIEAGTLPKGEQIFNNTDLPVIMPWVDSTNAGKADLQPTMETFGILEYVANVVFCSNKYNDFSADRITAGYTGQWPESILTSLGEALDKEVVPVPYKNSGETVLGFQAGNVDYVALASSRLTKLPEGTCFAVTGDREFAGMGLVKEIITDYEYNDLAQHGYWLIKNFDDNKEIRNILHEAIQHEEYAKWHNKKFLNVPTVAFDLEHLENSYNGAYAWGRQPD